MNECKGELMSLSPPLFVIESIGNILWSAKYSRSSNVVRIGFPSTALTSTISMPSPYQDSCSAIMSDRIASAKSPSSEWPCITFPFDDARVLTFAKCPAILSHLYEKTCVPFILPVLLQREPNTELKHLLSDMITLTFKMLFPYFALQS